MATAAVIMGAVMVGATTERAGTPQTASSPGPPAAMFRVAVAPLDPRKPVFDSQAHFCHSAPMETQFLPRQGRLGRHHDMSPQPNTSVILNPAAA